MYTMQPVALADWWINKTSHPQRYFWGRDSRLSRPQHIFKRYPVGDLLERVRELVGGFCTGRGRLVSNDESSTLTASASLECLLSLPICNQQQHNNIQKNNKNKNTKNNGSKNKNKTGTRTWIRTRTTRTTGITRTNKNKQEQEQEEKQTHEQEKNEKKKRNKRMNKKRTRTTRTRTARTTGARTRKITGTINEQ